MSGTMRNGTYYTIYSQAGRKCPWCEKAAEALDAQGLPYNLRPLGRTELLEHAERANMNTVPIIYHGVHLVGGYEDLVSYIATTADAVKENTE